MGGAEVIYLIWLISRMIPVHKVSLSVCLSIHQSPFLALSLPPPPPLYLSLHKYVYTPLYTSISTHLSLLSFSFIYLFLSLPLVVDLCVLTPFPSSNSLTISLALSQSLHLVFFRSTNGQSPDKTVVNPVIRMLTSINPLMHGLSLNLPTMYYRT